MAAVDSFQMLSNHIIKQVNDNVSYVLDAVAIVGAYYLIRFSIDFGYCTFIHYSRSLAFGKNFIKLYGRWAVVTGSTSGIGQEFCRQLAEKGMNIILIGRNADLCEKESKYLEKRYGIHTLIIVHDFCTATTKHYDMIREELEGREIGVLINNAGVHYDHPMHFTEVEQEKLLEICNVNVTGLVMLTHTILPSMVARKRGLIVNLSSGAGWLPFPLITLYSASKSFVSHFSKSLNLELEAHNIHVQSLEPMYVSTRMTNYSSILNAVKWFNPDPKCYVRSAIKSFGKTKYNTGYYPHTLQMLIVRWSPAWLTVRMSSLLHHYLRAEGLDKKLKMD